MFAKATSADSKYFRQREGKWLPRDAHFPLLLVRSLRHQKIYISKVDGADFQSSLL
jgi:hypothetical protein